MTPARSQSCSPRTSKNLLMSTDASASRPEARCEWLASQESALLVLGDADAPPYRNGMLA